jgi:histidine kinase
MKILKKFHRSIGLKLIVSVGIVLLISITTWAYFNIDYQKKKVMANIVASTDRLTNTIRLGAHYAMMLNSRDEINQIITNIAKQKEIENIRIYNKNGEIKFSNRTTEVDSKTDIKAEACFICHRSDPPMTGVPLSERLRFSDRPKAIVFWVSFRR